MNWITFYKEGKRESVTTFAEMADAIRAIRNQISLMNLYKGDRVIVRLPNSPYTVSAYLALRDHGLVSVPVGMQDTDTQLQFAIANSGARAVIRPDAITMIPQLQNDLDVPADLQTIIYTSGTTGQPKGVMLGKAQWLNNVDAVIAHHGLTEHTVICSPLPLSHVNAHGFAMLASRRVGCQYMMFDKPSPAMLDAVNREGVTILSVVPAILYRLVREYPTWKPHAGFQYILTAAAPLAGSLLADVMGQWGVRVVQGYGLSESTNFSCTLPVDLPDDLYRHLMFPRPSIGIAVPGVTLAIGDHDKEGQEGEIKVKSPSNYLGYLGHPPTDHTWVSTGDLGYYVVIEGRRFYYITGRIKKQINRGGESLSPVAIEEELRAAGIPGDFAVVGMPDERLGEEIAMVCTEPFEHVLLHRIPASRRPKHWVIVSSIPRTATGKVQRKEAAKLLW